ncbi:cullin-associated NEDD8-dissociated protein 1 [Aspergillus brasiliensis]|uniref:Cullin-associated NEDD8-dissociated protein 1 n=1 Tax=Aspergillus brasiliensis TaxID=319629 RepID=A0A9W5YNC3_9EURO|nr:cullin-associated NEDD8-dissociated protein 1 [Aspergillus brasiliensis]GKZ45994.1 cullin-associated NEDD8-dissociated protein 1 [Aspergillus brasiliensis]
MPLSDHAPRLEFLKGSASALNAHSPSTAAYLMTIHNGILRDEFKPLNQRLQETSCGACGSVRSPQWTKTIVIQKKKGKQSNAGRAGKASSDGATILKCLRCRRRTVKPVRKDAARPALPPKATPTAAAATTPDIQSSAATTPQNESATELADQGRVNKAADNASSKKRAKARKQGGLQALMASKQQSRSNSSSLDLFDFLQ